MNNNEIIKRLMGDGQKSTQTSNTSAVVQSSQIKEDEFPMSRIRVVTVKYKVYIVLLLIVIAALLMNYIPSVKDSYDASNSAYKETKSQLNIIQNEITEAEKDVDYLEEIVSNEQNLKSCLNEKNTQACLSLPDGWKERENEEANLTIPLSYMQLHSLYNEKMPVDEKKVLRNLNEYLIKQDISWTSRIRVWDILKISIWDPEAAIKDDKHFFAVPVDVEIRFTTIGDLTGFLFNVEKKIINNAEDRILYKIQSVSYDIVSNDEPQITEISMLAYYYHDERFENVDEETAILDEHKDIWWNDENNNEKVESKIKSDSFFNKLFES